MAKKDGGEPLGAPGQELADNSVENLDTENDAVVGHFHGSKHRETKRFRIPKNHLIFFAVFLLALLVLSSYTGVFYYKNKKTSRVVAEEIASVHEDPFTTSPVEAFINANPNSTVTSTLNKILNSPITFQYGSSTFSPSSTDIASLLLIDTNLTTKTQNILVDQAKVKAYVEAFVTNNTHPATEQQVATHPDGSSDILVKGVDGQSLGQADQAVNTIIDKLLLAQPFTVSFSSATTPFTTTSSPLFSKLLEVDLTSKQMWAYENGVLIKTFLVSAGAPLTPTPVGTFHIYEKLLSQNMSGYNYDGTPYFQPNVPYVNYFTGADAIHGNYWRPLSWFGNINSSHGCVGVDVSDGEWIYNWAPIGTTVITHY